MTPDDAAKPPCTACGSQNARCVVTRWHATYGMTYRRRECRDCGARYSTLEGVIDLSRSRRVTIDLHALSTSAQPDE